MAPLCAISESAAMEESVKRRFKTEGDVFSIAHIRVAIASGFLAWAASWLHILIGDQPHWKFIHRFVYLYFSKARDISNKVLSGKPA